MTRTALCAALVGLLCTAIPATAQVLLGRVVGVSDGDTLTVLDSTKMPHRVRLSGIDAPEKRQPFGERSKENLSRLAFGKDARAECHKQDRYGRQVCRVSVAGQDVAVAQLESGLAWWFRRYASEQPPQERTLYEAIETRASIDRVGLWRDPDPVPPWEWRKRLREQE